MKSYFVYIMASKRGGVLYTGITSELQQRDYQHKHGIMGGFTKRYNVHRLVYFEVYDEPTLAITREKQIKKWNRAWKIELIEKANPEWNDLSSQIA